MPSQLSPVLRYGVALVVTGVALSLMMLLPPLRAQTPYLLFFAAIVFSAWFGGLGPGLVATVASMFAAELFVRPPPFVLDRSLSDLVRMTGFVVASGFIAALTARTRRAEEVARAYGDRFQATLASVGDAVIVTDTQGRVTFTNAVAASLIGWSADEVRGQPVEQVFPIVNEETLEPVDNPVARVLREGVVVGLANHTVLMSRDGSRRPIDDSGAPIRAEGGRISGAVLVFRDVTGRRQAEFELRESEERFRMLADTARVLIWMSGTDALRNFFNKTWLEFTGRTLEQELGECWLEGVHPDDVQRCLETYRSSFQARQEFQMEYRLRRFDGEYIWVLDTGIPRWSSDDTFAGYIGSGIDITDRREAEVERGRLLEREHAARLEAEEALRARDGFLSVAAHELKTPLTSLKGFTQLSLRQLGRADPGLDPSRVRQTLVTIDRQAERLSRLINHLLDLTRIEAGHLRIDRERTDLVRLIEGVVATSRDAAQSHPIVVRAPTSVPVVVDPTRIEQVVANLLDNAIKYASSGGDIVVEVTMPAPDFVRVSVTDQGTGIPVEQRPHIFDRYFQAHADTYASGLGIGLFVSQQIVQLHGGTIEAQFPPEGGTRFVVILPTGLNGDSSSPASDTSSRG